ncbi:13991_t:CDS:2 [Funneliformis caledonium]|uniref:13991_t:CDS:1 n=1 Tax=Funneliformis caledonium TaxID=1117310 RepID=A0A9N8V166_9GLOM|nr:13991_t:CDS:2 [Funneliformis caledonium]
MNSQDTFNTQENSEMIDPNLLLISNDPFSNSMSDHNQMINFQPSTSNDLQHTYYPVFDLSESYDGYNQELASEYHSQTCDYVPEAARLYDIIATTNTNMSNLSYSPNNYASHIQDVDIGMYPPPDYMNNPPPPIMSDDRNCNQGFDDITEPYKSGISQSGESCKEINENKEPQFVWKDVPTKLLLTYFKENKKKVQNLTKRGSTAGKIKKLLWKGACIRLRKNGYNNYSEKR